MAELGAGEAARQARLTEKQKRLKEALARLAGGAEVKQVEQERLGEGESEGGAGETEGGTGIYELGAGEAAKQA